MTSKQEWQVRDMPQVQVKDMFELPDPHLFVLAGVVVEGEVQPGMWVNVPISEVLTFRAPILEVETTTRSGREDLCLHCEPELGRVLRKDGVRNPGPDHRDHPDED